MMDVTEKNDTGIKIATGIVILAIIIPAFVFIAPAINSPCCTGQDAVQSDGSVEANACGCRVTSAELWQFNIAPGDYSDTSYVGDYTLVVKWQDGWYVQFTKDYFLRVQFNTYLEEGDMIIIYARWNTVPTIKGAKIYLTNGTEVGYGEVLPQWNYYMLNITESISPNDTFDIVINGGNPSSQKMRIDKVKCGFGEPEPPEERWRDPETGVPVDNYTINFNYMVITDGNVDDSEVYLDLEIRQNITDDNAGNATIVATLLEKDTIHVVSVNTTYHYETTAVDVIDHAIAGTDNITIRVDVQATAYGKIEGTSSWIAMSKTYLSLRELEACWY